MSAGRVWRAGLSVGQHPWLETVAGIRSGLVTRTTKQGPRLWVVPRVVGARLPTGRPSTSPGGPRPWTPTTCLGIAPGARRPEDANPRLHDPSVGEGAAVPIDEREVVAGERAAVGHDLVGRRADLDLVRFDDRVRSRVPDDEALVRRLAPEVRCSAELDLGRIQCCALAARCLSPGADDVDDYAPFATWASTASPPMTCLRSSSRSTRSTVKTVPAFNDGGARSRRPTTACPTPDSWSGTLVDLPVSKPTAFAPSNCRAIASTVDGRSGASSVAVPPQSSEGASPTAKPGGRRNAGSARCSKTASSSSSLAGRTISSVNGRLVGNRLTTNAAHSVHRRSRGKRPWRQGWPLRQATPH